MLTRSNSNDSTPVSRNPRRERRLWHDGSRNTPGLGCLACREHCLCGGLEVSAAFYDCLQFCCGQPQTCDRVCRNHPDYTDRVREVGTFCLDSVPRAPKIAVSELPRVIPVIFHGNRREIPIVPGAAALPLYRMFDRRSGAPRYCDHVALCAAFGIAPGTTILLTGTDRDPPLERWWGLGEMVRRTIIRALKAAGVALVTTPNYSLFIDRPRWDDLHAMKRIAIVHEEFLTEGMPAALHVNGRTETDFRRWSAYVAGRPEITHLAYEFTTGTGWVGRREQHAAWLGGLAGSIGRPVDLVVRGGIEVLPKLSTAFGRVTVLDTSIFMKTMMRRSAQREGDAGVSWQRSPTAIGAPLDDLFASNRETVAGWLGDLATAALNKVRAPP
jgi:hypothetical protein